MKLRHRHLCSSVLTFKNQKKCVFQINNEMGFLCKIHSLAFLSLLEISVACCKFSKYFFKMNFAKININIRIIFGVVCLKCLDMFECLKEHYDGM